MKRIIVLAVAISMAVGVRAQSTDYNSQMVDGQSCTSIMVGKRASTDGSVITSHTCDGRG